MYEREREGWRSVRSYREEGDVYRRQCMREREREGWRSVRSYRGEGDVYRGECMREGITFLKFGLAST